MANNLLEPFVSSEDNVVLSDLLFFIANRLNTHPAEVIIHICDTFYDEPTIWNEKIRFFKSINKTASERRSNKKLKNLEDIVNEMRARDKSSAFLPIYAATSLHNIPTTDDGSVTNAQLLASWRSIQQNLVSKNELNLLLTSTKNSILDSISSLVYDKSHTAISQSVFTPSGITKPRRK